MTTLIPIDNNPLRAFAASREPTFLFLTRSREGAKGKFLPQWGRGTSVAGGGAREVGRGGDFKGRWLVFGEGWGVGGIGQLACAPPPSFGWFPSQGRGGMG